MTKENTLASVSAVPAKGQARAPSAPRRIDDRHLVTLLAGLAAVLSVAYLTYQYVLPLTPVRLLKKGSALIPQSEFWSFVAGLPLPVPHSPGLLAIVLVTLIAITFLAYATAVVVCWNRPGSRGTLLAVALPAAAFFVLSAFSLPTTSTDIYDYIVTARVATAHGSNPYLVPTDAFPEDPVFPYVEGRWTHEPQTKGPAFVLPIMAWAALAGDSPLAALLIYRLGFLAFNLASLGLVVVFLRRWRPRHLLAGTVLYGWSPIVVIHGQEKSEAIMVCLMLAGIVALFSGRRLAAVAALGLSVFVKLLTLPLLAAYFVRELAARRLRHVAGAGALLGLVVAVLYSPFTRRPGLVLDHLSQTGTAGPSLPAVAMLVLATIAAGLVIWAGLAGLRGNDQLVRASTVVALFLGAFFYPQRWSWYLMVSIALAALTGDRWLTLLAVALSFVAFSFDRWAQSTHRDFPLPQLDVVPIPFLYLGALALVVAAIVTVLVISRTRSRATGSRTSL